MIQGLEKKAKICLKNKLNANIMTGSGGLRLYPTRIPTVVSAEGFARCDKIWCLGRLTKGLRE